MTLTSSVAIAAPTGNTQFFSDDGSLLLHIDWQRLQQGQTPKTLLNMVMMSPRGKEGLANFKTKYGLDPFKDITSASLFMKFIKKGEDPEVLLHLKAKLDPAKFVAGLRADGNDFKEEKVAGRTLMVSEATKSALTFVEGGVLMGSPSRIRSAVQKSGYGGVLAAQQAKLAKGGDIWFVAQLPEAMRQEMKLSNPDIAESKSMRGFIDFSAGLHFGLITEFVSPEVAAGATAKLKAIVEQAKQNPQAAMFMTMINKLAATASGAEMTVDLPLNQDEVNQLQAIAQMLMMSLTMRQPGGAPAGGAAPAAPAPAFPQLQRPTAPAAPAPVAPAPVAPAPVAPASK